MTDQIYLTVEGADKLRQELSQLKGVGRDEISRRLRDAIQMGDLSENADYSKAKEDQAFLEGRIQDLERVLHDSIIVENHSGAREIVEVGAKITVQEEDFPPDTYLLVGAKEADPRNGKISHESPIGKVLMGKREGDFVTAITPGGQVRLKILKIE